VRPLHIGHIRVAPAQEAEQMRILLLLKVLLVGVFLIDD